MKARPYFSKPPAGFRPKVPRKADARFIEEMGDVALELQYRPVEVRRCSIAIPFSAWRALNEAKAPRRKKP